MVVVLASERGLWIAWPSNEEWQVAAGSWPDGCCRDGMPLQLEAMAALLSDLLLERRFVEAQNTLDLREQQQEVLLDLIAGQDRIQTFLALLGQEARASGVEIRRYEPLTAPSSTTSTERRSRSSQQTKPESAKNPMQELGYHQSSIALQVTGGYAGLQQFLQRMERLQLLVESSELSLKTTTASKPDQEGSGVLAPAPTDLSLRLTFYDRKPDAAPKSKSGAQSRVQTDDKAPS